MKPHSTKIFRDLVNAIGSYIQCMFLTNTGGPNAALGKSNLSIEVLST